MLSSSVLLFLCALASTAPSASPHANSHIHHQHHEKRAGGASRGLLYAPGPALSAFSGKVEWSVNWATAPSTNVNLGTFVSQLWGIDVDHAGNFQADSGNYEDAPLIGFNEPDIQGEAWILPSTAVDNWATINNYKSSKNAKIGTPGCSNSALPPQSGGGIVNNPQGIEWQKAFLSQATAQGYKFDMLTWHWYGGDANSVEQDQAMLQQQATAYINLASQYNIPEVWITEMQRKNGDDECQFIQWFENTFLPQNPQITHYAYNEQVGTLTTGDGLTAAGQAYIGEGGC